VEADVFGRGTQYGGIVLELPKTAVAVETEQGSDFARGMVMIDMHCRRGPADGAQPVLLREKEIRLGRRDPVSPGQVICP
jgi:hypothetical protein